MRKILPADLEAFIDTYMQRKYVRMLDDRFFAAKVLSVTQTGNAFTCRLIKNSDDTPDGHDYLCAAPYYIPQVGDQVDCIWRDNVGYVLFKVDGYSPVRSRVSLRTAGQNAATGLTVVAFNTLDYGDVPTKGGWVLGAGATYTAKQKGNYDARWAVATQNNNNPQRFYSSLYYKPVGGAFAEYARGTDFDIRGGVANDPIGSTGADIVPMNKGDQLQIQVFNGGAGAVVIQPSQVLTYCTIGYLGI